MAYVIRTCLALLASPLLLGPSTVDARDSLDTTATYYHPTLHGSLMANGELRPMIADLRLVAVAYDPTGRNSVAIMRDVSTKEQYRVKVGQTLGRMRAARIQPKEVVFTIEEFGLSRQAVLALSDSTTARTK